MSLLRWVIISSILAFAMRPLLGPHQISGHSTYSDLVRAEAFHAAVSHGDWTPRWLPDFYFRHGSPTFHYYAPGGYYLIELLRRLGASPLWALKIAFLLPWLLGAAATYQLAKEVGGTGRWNRGADLALLAYCLAPYLLIDVYMRNGIAEVAGFGLFPCALWATWRTAKKAGASPWLLAILASAGLALSHNITSLVATPILLGLAVAGGDRLGGKRRAAGAVLLGLAVAAFFWLPALLGRDWVTAEQSLTGGYFNYQQHFLDPLGVVTPAGGGPLVIGPQETASIKLGAPLVVALLGALLTLAVPSLRRRLKVPAVVGYFFGAAVLCLFMSTALSAFLWRTLPLLGFVQFPWRFLLPATCLAAPLIGLLPKLAPRRAWRWIRYGLMVLTATVATPYIVRVYLIFEHDPSRPAATATNKPEESVHLPAAKMVGVDPAKAGLVAPHRVLTIEAIRNRGVTGTASHDFLPRGVEQLPGRQPPAAEVVGGAARIVDGGWGSPTYPTVWAEIEAESEARVALGQFWFPGWRAQLDSEPVEVTAEPRRGRLLITVPPGRHRLEAHFGASSLVWIGYGVSLLGWFVVVAGLRRMRRATRPTFILAAE